MVPYVPFPINVTLSSPLFQLEPISQNGSFGWTPSCASPACVSAATWSTSTPNSTLIGTFWGHDIVLEGRVQGNVDIRVTVDGREVGWNPDNDVLLSVHGLNDLVQHTVSLTMFDASVDGRLTVNQAHVNGTTRTGTQNSPAHRWTVSANNAAISYTGFSQQMNMVDLVSPTTYSSLSAGDKASVTFNGSALLIYGPCGPSNGLMRVTIDEERTVVNTSKPIRANDCLLFQSKGIIGSYRLHDLVVENIDGEQLGIDRIEFIRTVFHRENGAASTLAGTAIGTSVKLIAIIILLTVVHVMDPNKLRKRRE